MNKLLIAFSISVLSVAANSAVCNQIKNIEGFSSAALFDEAIINGKSLDYYSFVSKCDISCLLQNLKKKNISYSLNNKNISVFDKSSVATIILDNSLHKAISGYMTCSSTEKRKYIYNPISLSNNKITLDLQTSDYINTTRTINLEKYSKSEYLKVLGQLNRLTKYREATIGFTNYKITSKGGKRVIKVSKLTPRGDFILIVEQSR
uniref:hypothetical protein n=1 Tax=uncultured Psychrobacter sp. TaxID=259303 RepID=UPI00260DF985|nr:hypothetical protein [uncultured Psychrobacter sp.]